MTTLSPKLWLVIALATAPLPSYGFGGFTINKRTLKQISSRPFFTTTTTRSPRHYPISFLDKHTPLQLIRDDASMGGVRSGTELRFWKNILPGNKKESTTETTEPEVNEDDEIGKEGVNVTTTTTTTSGTASSPFFASVAPEPKSDSVIPVEKEAVEDTPVSKAAAAAVGNEGLDSGASSSFVLDTITEEKPMTTLSLDTDNTITPVASSDSSVESSAVTTPLAAESTATETTTVESLPVSTKDADKDPVLTEAMLLRRQAEKARLEAEKMDAMLTLEKISKLEKQLESKSVTKDPEKAAEVKNQISLLRRKLEEPSNTTPPAGRPSLTTMTSSKPSTTTTATTSPTADELFDKEYPETLTPEILKERVEAFKSTPGFLRTITAKAAGFENDSNATAVVLKMYADEREFLKAQQRIEMGGGRLIGDGVFSEEDLQREVERFEKMPRAMRDLTARFIGFENADNSTAVILAMREKELADRERNGADGSASSSPIATNQNDEEKRLSDLFNAASELEPSDSDRMMESLFPRTTRKEGEGPTEAQVRTFSSQVCKDAFFRVSGPPEKVPGGYILRGENRCEDGAALISALDRSFKEANGIDESVLQFFYVNDPTPVTDYQMESGERPPVLLITGSDVSRPFNILLSLVTAFGLGGISFLSVYPFALDEAVASRVEEQLSLATADTPANLDFLSDLTAPIFFSYLVVQVAHELGHFIVAKLNGFDVRLPPTWVPSPTLGLTGSVTAIKTPPKNKQALLDFALAGPLTGMLLSTLLLVAGLQMTLTADAEAFKALPQLPISFLYQSSLAGGIVEAILGKGILNAPDPLTATVRLHPLAISGLASLLVNALSLLPFGRTDGGRVSLALLGRTGAQLVSLITAAVLLITGLFLSDALLFYFSFVLFFEAELEIPCRNEVDEVDFSRVLAATATAVLVLLTVIPIA